jgi:amidase
MSDPTALAAVDLSEAIRRRECSCRELMTACLARIARLNPRVNALVSLQDQGRLLAQADERDMQLARGEHLGWMHGFPIAIKDLVATAGIRTTLGSPLLREFIPAEDSIMVARIKAAGAIVIGKTNTPEFGLGSQTYNNVFGATRNAYDASKTAGGSSGGAAVAVALRLTPVADGSDMMGSLRNPAAYNNVFGFRPSYGRIPAGPVPEIYLQQLSSDGPMARSVPDLAMLLATQAGPDLRSPLSIAEDPRQFTGSLARDFAGVRIAWLGDLGGHLTFEPGVLELCRSALAAFEELGCVVEEVVPDFPFAGLWEAWCTLRHWLVAGRLNDFYKDPAKRPSIKPEALWEIERGLALRAIDVYEASRVRSAWYQVLNKLFATYEFLVLPSAQVFPFDANLHWPAEIAGRRMDTYHRWMEVVVPGSFSGCPMLGAPVGFSERGLPMGMQIIGRSRADFAVLQLGHAYDQARTWVKRRPPPE